MTEHAVFIADEATSFGRNPKGIVRGDGQIENIVVGESGGVIAIEQNQALTIKAQQAAGSSDPKISVFGLRKGLNRLLGKTILHLPGTRSVVDRRVAESAGTCREHAYAQR